SWSKVLVKMPDGHTRAITRERITERRSTSPNSRLRPRDVGTGCSSATSVKMVNDDAIWPVSDLPCFSPLSLPTSQKVLCEKSKSASRIDKEREGVKTRRMKEKEVENKYGRAQSKKR